MRSSPFDGSRVFLYFFIFAAPIFAQASPEATGTVVVESERLDVPEFWKTSSSVSILEVGPDLSSQTGVAGLVARAPGIHLSQFGDPESFSGVSIRGSTLRQVAVYLDGIPLNPDGSQPVNLSEWPVRALQRVEVYRGNAPIALGGAAMGGAIQMVTADEPLHFAGGTSVASTGRYAADGYSQFSVADTGTSPTLTLFADGVESDGRFTYFTDNGTPYNRTDDDRLLRDNNRTRSGAGLGRFRAKMGRTRLDVVDAWLLRSSGLPGHINNPAQHARLDVSRNLLGLNASHTVAANRIDATAWWLQRSGTLDDRADEIGLGMQNTRQRTGNLGARIHHRMAVQHWLGIGYLLATQHDQAIQINLDTNEEEPRIGRNVQTFALATPVSFERFGWSPVLHLTRVERIENTALYSMDPRMGLQYLPLSWLSLRSNAGTFLRPPTMMELYGDSGTMVGNPALRPERGTQWDVGARARFGAVEHVQVSVDGAHFWNVARDRITWLQNGQKTFKPTNFGHTWIQGLEGVLGAVFVDKIETHLSLTWTQSVNLDPDPGVANKEVPGIPGLNGYTSIACRFAANRARVAYDLRHAGPNYWDATNWHRSASRTFHDATIQVRPTKMPFQLELGVQNIFNQYAEIVPQNPLNPRSSTSIVVPVTDFNGYPLPGRVWSGSLRWLGGKS